MKLSASNIRARVLPVAGMLMLASAAFVSPTDQDATQLGSKIGVNPVRHWTTHCESTVNSTGVVSTMNVTGNLSIADNDTWIHSLGCPPGEYGVFLFGVQPAELPWGNGVLCISPFYPGLVRLNQPAIIDFSGATSMPFDMSALPASVQVVAGTEYYFQCMFRDTAEGSRFNLSNGVSVVFGL